MACAHKLFTVYEKAGALGNVTLKKNPAGAPDPSSDYTTVLNNAVDKYVTDNSDPEPNCDAGCYEATVKTVDTTPDRIVPQWTWSELYFDTSQPPQRVSARYTASAGHDISIIDKKKVCRPLSPTIRSAYLPGGQRKDVDVSQMLAALGEHPEQCEGSVETPLFEGSARPIDSPKEGGGGEKA